MSEKSCSKCKETKPLSQFNKVKDKHLPHCARCQYIYYQRPSALKRLEEAGKKPRALMTVKCKELKKVEARARSKKWSAENRDRRNASKRRRRAERNPPKPKVEKPVKIPKVRTKMADTMTPEELRVHRNKREKLYRANNPEKMAGQRTRRAAKAKLSSHHRVAKNLRKRLKEFLGTGTKLGSFSGMVGCSKEELVKHLEAQFTVGMSWENYGEWHIDHIKPIAAFDFSLPTSRKEVNHFSNLQPMWKLENESKSSLWEGVRYSKGKVV